MKKIFLTILFVGILNAEEIPLVKISEITIDCKYLDEYKKILDEESKASVKLESGVLILYPMQYKDNPCKFAILESYADEDSYKKHIQTKHFKNYKEKTLHMVKDLKFIPMDAMHKNMFLDKNSTN